LFAGEREERTSDWLSTLSAPPGWAFAAKVVWAIASNFSLHFLFSLAMLRYGINPVGEGSAVPLSLFVFVWGLLGSLVSRRVLISLAAMVAYWVLIYLLPISVYSRVLEMVHGFVPTGPIRSSTPSSCAFSQWRSGPTCG
jgi:hypothetical protein